MRLPEGKEGAGLSGGRQKDRRNAELSQEWLGGHCEVTAKSEVPHVFRRVPIFQTSGNVVQVKGTAAGYEDAEWEWPLTKGAEQVSMAWLG